MNWFFNVKIRNKFLIIFGSIVLSAIVAIVALQIIFEKIQVGGTYYKGIAIKRNTIDEIARIRMNINLIRSSIYSYIIFKDDAYIETIQGSIKKTDQIIEALNNKFNKDKEALNCYNCHVQNELDKVYKSINSFSDSWLRLKSYLMKLINYKTTEDDTTLTNFEDEYITFMEISKNPLDELRSIVPKQVRNLVALSNKIRLFFAVLGLVAIAFIIYVAVVLYRNIKISVNDVVRLSNKISNGDIRDIKTTLHGKDELGMMATTFEQMSIRLKEFINDIKSGINDLFTYSNTILEHADTLYSSANQQKSNVNQILAATEEIESSVQVISQNASDASEKTQESFELASAGYDLAQQAKDQIERISKVVNLSAEILDKLGHKAKEIEKIVDVINEIAEQTNLLALNAAIEAARAGEHGKGFAIVADEVRKLAEKTANSTKEISEKIKTIQDETFNSVTTIKESLEEVSKGTKIVENVKDALSSIVESASTVSEMVNQIAQSTEQHLVSVEDISQSIQHLISDVDRTVNISDNLKNLSSDLSELAKKLKHLSEYYKSDNKVIDIQEENSYLEYQAAPTIDVKRMS